LAPKTELLQNNRYIAKLQTKCELTKGASLCHTRARGKKKKRKRKRMATVGKGDRVSVMVEAPVVSHYQPENPYKFSHTIQSLARWQFSWACASVRWW
jgi:hypothetical protein